MTQADKSENQSFWEHLDVLRGYLIKITAVVVVCSIVAFFFKEQLFTVILAPKDAGFVTYRVLDRIGQALSGEQMPFFAVKLINTGLAEQFIIHMKTALYVGFLCASPYTLYLLYCFVSPGLYAQERKYVVRVVGSSYLMFMIGVCVSYFLIFPLTFRFLGTYQVSAEVDNMITLNSYMGTLFMMNLAMGIVFEIPILSWLFAKLGFISAQFMQRYRKHAIVIILIIAALITPTSDIFTLLLVAFPMWLLYEVSILIVKRV